MVVGWDRKLFLQMEMDVLLTSIIEECHALPSLLAWIPKGIERNLEVCR